MRSHGGHLAVLSQAGTLHRAVVHARAHRACGVFKQIYKFKQKDQAIKQAIELRSIEQDNVLGTPQHRAFEQLAAVVAVEAYIIVPGETKGER